MTLEQLLKAPACELKKLSREEVETLLSPYLILTRPTEEALKNNKPPKQNKSSGNPITREKQSKIEKARALANKYGVDLGF